MATSFFDCYDRTRIATWLRNHEGLIPWARTLVGRSIPGWQSYGAWAYDPVGAAAEYLLEEKLRLRPARQETEHGLTTKQGIKLIRDVLRQQGRVVRLVGLSGVGKTRLVQALFDERLGDASLDSSLAVYANMADMPDPQPIAMASNLVAAGTRAVLVIDNWPPDLHQRLSEVCRQGVSKLSVITVEYDIREDIAEGTEVFTLESSSQELIEQLIRGRFQKLSQIDVHAIAKSSDGNARVALALAATVEQSGTVAGLTDEQLFQRLFWQRHRHDESLYLIAQACALVYSFNGEDTSGGDATDLVCLSRLVGMTPDDVYQGVAELKRRGLVQQRSVWRAILPHAIANRLARTGLQSIRYALIEGQLLTVGAERLLRSLSRRLGYLHISPEATRIAKQWLAPEGLLASVGRLSELGQAMFKNIAPAAPIDALAALERALLAPAVEAELRECRRYSDLLCRLAYDPALFARSVDLLVKLETADSVDAQSRSVRALTSLFQLYYSATLATIEQRAAAIGSLLRASDERRCVIGILGLKALLEALHFDGASSFDFGTRSRDFGYWPRTRDEVHHWFKGALQLVETFACGDTHVALYARAALAEKFRGLWLRSASQDELGRVCIAIRQHHFWPEGWISVRQTLDLHGKEFDPECLERLAGLEKALRPASLVQRVRATVLSTRLTGVGDFEDHSSDEVGTRMARTDALARELGKAVAAQPEVLAELLSDVVSSDGLLWMFGEGLVAAAPDARELWRRLVDALTATEETDRKPQILRGVLHQLSAMNANLAASLLDEAVENEPLSSIYPLLQSAVDIGARDMERLKRSVTLGKAPAAVYGCLAHGNATGLIPASDLQGLLLAIATLPSGLDIAVHILQMRMSFDKCRKLVESPPELVDAGRVLLDQFTPTRNSGRDYSLREIAAACLRDERGIPIVSRLCRKLKNSAAKYETDAHRHEGLILALFTAHPVVALDGFFGGDQNELDVGIDVLGDVVMRRHLLDCVPENELLIWCDKVPNVRFAALAGVISLSNRSGENAPSRWTSLALRFLERAPDANSLLRIFTSRFVPSTGWSGSLATILESKVALLDQLDAYPALKHVVVEEKERVIKWIEEERHREKLMDCERDERFE